MELSVLDRIRLLDILPEKGDIITLRILRELREALSFTEAELAEIHFYKPGEMIPDPNGAGGKSILMPGQIAWDKSVVVDVKIGKKANDILCGTLKEASQKKALTKDHLALWDKFFPEEED